MTNVKLSQEELEIVTDAELILTKNRIIGKVYDLFGSLSEVYRAQHAGLPEKALGIPPKISKGENYKGLPWVMLDYPRAFSQSDVFAVRSFFWWGNFFSITLQLQGAYLHDHAASIEANLSRYTNWWICADATDAWQHDFDAGYYKPWKGNMKLGELPFIKLAKKIPLQQWDEAPVFFETAFGEIQAMLSAKPVE